jgi:hypothetical protein
MRRGHLAELFFDLEPHGIGIDADVVAGQAGQEQLAAVLALESERKTFGTLSLPLSSMRACSWPLNTPNP